MLCLSSQVTSITVIYGMCFQHTNSMLISLQREKNILDQLYSTVKCAYKAAPHPRFGQSGHISVFLYPAYRQLLKQTLTVSKTVKMWTE